MIVIYYDHFGCNILWSFWINQLQSILDYSLKHKANNNAESVIFHFLSSLQIVEVSLHICQLFIATFLQDLPFIEHIYPVRVYDCFYSVGDHQTCLTLHQTVNIGLNLLLCLAIKSWCSLVKNQDLRLSNQGSRYGHSLLLATWQRCPHDSHFTLKPILSVNYEVNCFRFGSGQS